MHADAIDDSKLKLLAFEDRWHFVAILCLKSQGELDSKKQLDRRVAMKLGLQLKDADEVRRRLIEIGLIRKNWQPVAWENRQYVSDNSTERVKKHREKMKRFSNVAETPPDTDTDTDTDKIKNLTVLAPCPHQKVLTIWAEVMPEKRQPRTWEATEKTNLSSRWKFLLTATDPSTGKAYCSDESECLDWLRRFFAYCRKSDFLFNQCRPFDLKWLVKRANFNKILEGNYHD